MTNLQNFFAHLSEFLGNRASRRNVVILLLLLLAVGTLVATFSMLFHVFMEREGREFGWFTGVYWTLTVMSTLGFGDITFTSTAGRMFSMAVLLSGTVFVLILLPFTVIQFIYLPWMETQAKFRTPRKLSSDVNGHVLLTHYDPVSSALIGKLGQYDYQHVLLIADASEASRLQDLGLTVVTGYLDDTETYRNVNVDSAAMVAMTGNDVINANLAFIVRQVSSAVPLVATATEPASVDILEFAGIDQVFQLKRMMGNSLARHTRMRAFPARIIGDFDELAIAEANVVGTSLVGRTLEEIGLRRNIGLSIAGIWERGRFEAALPSSKLNVDTILVLAGSRDQIGEFNRLFRTHAVSDFPVVIIGGGRVGHSTAQALREIGVESRIVEKLDEQAQQGQSYVLGDAAEREVLEKAGIFKSPSVVITTHDDDTNLYLTIYCRSLCPNIQIVSRCTLERNVGKMHEAGADFVMSYASMGANAILSNLERSDTVMVDEGLDVFKVTVPSSLVGKSISGSSIRRQTGCTVIAVGIDSDLKTNPSPDSPLPEGGEMVLIGSVESERKFLERFGAA
jgi:voltage-gated potassium channel